MTLEPRDIDAVARRVVEILDERSTPPAPLVSAAELAVVLGVDVVWVREHADLLGVYRLGAGPRARLRFDVQEARARLRAADRADVPADVVGVRAQRVRRSRLSPSGAPVVRPRRARRAA